MMLAQRGLFLVVMGSPPGGVVRAATNARATTTGVLCSDGFFPGGGGVLPKQILSIWRHGFLQLEHLYRRSSILYRCRWSRMEL